MPRYDSSKPTPDGQPPEENEDKGFFSFFMPAAGNAIQAAKWSADEAEKEEERTDRADRRKSKQDCLNDAHNALDACDKKLNQAKEDTEKRIEKRDSDNDEPKRRGWLW